MESAKKTSEFILNMKIEHFCSLNKKKVDVVYKAFLEEKTKL